MAVLKLITGPATEPVTVADVLSFARIDQSNQEPPPGIITAALPGTPVAGNVDNGAHRYLATFVTADGETQAGTISAAVTVADKTTNGKVSLTAIPLGGSLVTQRKLYRTVAAGTNYLLLDTISNNTATTYTDNIADSSLGAQAPTANTTTDSMLSMFITAARQQVENLTRRALITQMWELYLDQFPVWELFLPKPVLQSVTSITYVDSNGVTQTLAADQYTVDIVSEPGRITPAYGVVWPSTRWQTNSVCIRFVAGYGAAAAVPAAIKNWMLMRASTAFQNREELQISYRQSLVELPPSFIDGLLDPYTVEYFGPLNNVMQSQRGWSNGSNGPFGVWT